MDRLQGLEEALAILYGGSPAQVADADVFLRKVRADPRATLALALAATRATPTHQAWMFVTAALDERVAEETAKGRLTPDHSAELLEVLHLILAAPGFAAAPSAVHEHVCSANAAVVVSLGLARPPQARDLWNAGLDVASHASLRLEMFVHLAQAINTVSRHALAHSLFQDPDFCAAQANAVHLEASNVLSSSKALTKRRSAVRAIMKWTTHAQPSWTLPLLASAIRDPELASSVVEATGYCLSGYPALGPSHLIPLTSTLISVVGEAMTAVDQVNSEKIVHSVAEVAADIADCHIDHLFDRDYSDTACDDAVRSIAQLLLICLNSPNDASFAAACSGWSALASSATSHAIRDGPLLDGLPVVVVTILNRLQRGPTEDVADSHNGFHDAPVECVNSSRIAGGDCLLAVGTLLGPAAYAQTLLPFLEPTLAKNNPIETESLLFAACTAADITHDMQNRTFLPFVEAALSDLVLKSDSLLLRRGAMRTVASFAPLILSLNDAAYAQALNGITSSMLLVPTSSACAFRELVEVAPSRLVPHMEPLLTFFEGLVESPSIPAVVTQSIAVAFASAIATIAEPTQRASAVGVLLRRPERKIRDNDSPTIRALGVTSAVMHEIADPPVNVSMLSQLLPCVSVVLETLDGGCSEQQPQELAEVVCSLFVSGLMPPSKEYSSRGEADPAHLSACLCYCVGVIVKHYCHGPLARQDCFVHSFRQIIPAVESSSEEAKEVVKVAIEKIMNKLELDLGRGPPSHSMDAKIAGCQEAVSSFFQLLIVVLELSETMIQLIFMDRKDTIPRLCRLGSLCLVGSHGGRTVMNWWKSVLLVAARCVTRACQQLY